MKQIQNLSSTLSICSSCVRQMDEITEHRRPAQTVSVENSDAPPTFLSLTKRHPLRCSHVTIPIAATALLLRGLLRHVLSSRRDCRSFRNLIASRIEG